MKHIVLLLLLCTLPWLHSRASIYTLSEEAEISLLTCGSGAELYTVFGHSAIRIQDKKQGIDWVFNYGTFDFNTPHFYLKFAQGLLPYQLAVTSYEHFIYSYIHENRSVWSQELLLDSTDKQTLCDLLVENQRPENRTYRYSFLFDNCSTRIRDILDKTTDNGIHWKLPEQNKRFWNLLDEYLSRLPWVKWGIHTILGQPGNRKATPYEYMFLPDYLMDGMDSAIYQDKRLAGSPVSLFQAKPVDIRNPWYFSPFFILTIVCLACILLIRISRSASLLKKISLLFFIFSGLLGCLFIFLGYFTEHPITAPNFNLIWGNPLNLLVIPFLFTQRIPGIIRAYLGLYIAILVIGIPTWFFLQPAVSIASLPLLVLMIFLAWQLRRLPINRNKKPKSA